MPWVAVMALGFCFGPIFEQAPDGAAAAAVRASASARRSRLSCVRAFNIYGDPSRWSWRRHRGCTVLSFLNTTKYPPSLAFLLMTLGPALLVLSMFDRTIVVAVESADRVRPRAAVLLRAALRRRPPRRGRARGR